MKTVILQFIGSYRLLVAGCWFEASSCNSYQRLLCHADACGRHPDQRRCCLDSDTKSSEHSSSGLTCTFCPLFCNQKSSSLLDYHPEERGVYTQFFIFVDWDVRLGKLLGNLIYICGCLIIYEKICNYRCCWYRIKNGW